MSAGSSWGIPGGDAGVVVRPRDCWPAVTRVVASRHIHPRKGVRSLRGDLDRLERLGVNVAVALLDDVVVDRGGYQQAVLSMTT
jgi:hypothetical protein